MTEYEAEPVELAWRRDDHNVGGADAINRSYADFVEVGAELAEQENFAASRTRTYCSPESIGCTPVRQRNASALACVPMCDIRRLRINVVRL